MQDSQRLIVVAVVVVTTILILQKVDIRKYTGISIETKRKLNSSLNVDIPAAKKASQELLSLIRARYELDGPIGSQFFLSANNMGEETWDIMKYKFAYKMTKQNQQFLMIFGGSSVTAGHDNYYNQSYPAIVDKRMGPILTFLGIKFEVHNIAQGANNCIPYSFCYEAMGGLNPDFVNWEQSYNCGHDDPVFELVGRVAAFSHGVVYYSASGAWNPEKCPPSKDSPPFSAEEWKPVDAGIAPWEPSQADVQAEKALLVKYNKAKSTATRFASWSRDVKGAGAHGFNVWEENPMCSYKKDGADKMGCNGIDSTMQCAMRFMTKEAGEYGIGHGAAWHPTRAFHMLRGEAISWLYTLALLDALYMVEADLQTKSAEELTTEYEKKLGELQPAMPAPKRCKEYHCDMRPTCFTDFRPHFPSNMTLSELVVGKTGWTYDEEEDGEWSLQYGYKDAKPAWHAVGTEPGELHLRIKIGNTNFVWICGERKEGLIHVTTYLDANVKFPESGNFSDYEPSEKRVKWEHRKYVGNECKSIIDLPVGEHVLTLSTADSKADHHTSLSHVITWP